MSKKSHFTNEENAILEAYERGEYASVLTDNDRRAHIAAARQTFKKDKRVNIRIAQKDFELLQERALREGLPYQTLISSVLHKFVNGRFVNRETQQSAPADALGGAAAELRR
jgi:predicted DNA binding CopG/RHH family protein